MARVLHVLSSTMRAGVEMMVMNLYRQTDREKLQFDFIAHAIGSDDLGEEIASLGGRVFRIPLLSRVGILRFIKTVRQIIEENGPYAAVHAHTDFQGGFSAMAAWQAGVPVRICHAHSDTRVFRSPVQNMKNLLGRVFISRYATQRCACSQNAALSLFGRRAVGKGRVKIIPNSIDVSAYESFDPKTKEDLLRLCGAGEGSRLIGFVGRLHPIKNPSFILQMAAEAKKQNRDYRFILAGAGDLEQELLQKKQLWGLDQNVFFTGTRQDIPALMQCFDLLLVPSLTEGFSLTALEAQAAGTPVLAAPCVPPGADMGLGLLHRLPLSAGAAGWLEQAGIIIKSSARPDAAKRMSAIREKGHDSGSSANMLMKLYGIDIP